MRKLKKWSCLLLALLMLSALAACGKARSGSIFTAWIRSGNFIASWMKNTGMLLPTRSQLPSEV